MSDSSLSDVPIGLEDMGLDEADEPTLPTLLPSLYLQPPGTMLPLSSSPLFVKNLYRRTLLDSILQNSVELPTSEAGLIAGHINKYEPSAGRSEPQRRCLMHSARFMGTRTERIVP
ncbi:hypothetical protein V501_06387 [Pseudogymnoascus sp. VKM F-4519 (FW-2642)]|nr:hypothetical protein V501_06387 [Pseudogymnoascus sp. VKM F-4519 (FW-2642)]